MKTNNNSALIKILVLAYLSVLCVSQGYDFFYFVQQWPGSYCDTKKGCCNPTTGQKPAANFTIIGLWPRLNNGTYPKSCDLNNLYDESQISDLISSMQKEWPSLSCPGSNGTDLWAYEWNRHGTCSESVLDQHDYFQANLNFKNNVSVLQALQTAGIEPDGNFYSVESIKAGIKEGTGFSPGITCNVDPSGNSQLYQIYFCVDASGSDFFECSVFPKGNKPCASEVEFPIFTEIGETYIPTFGNSYFQ
ncbi:Ribonuclease T2-like [Trema orientale]|uniref:Ribonuclease T2-like n=1 Tax=Trema orientale TaxID=63057 RepID=A0A2P5CZV5_TREOI|nr:Ribonuclease T2-like [Trema orientale]